MERADRDRDHVDDVVEARGEALEVVDDLVETLLAVVDEVHLVHREDDVADAEEVGDEGVAAGLLDDAEACVHEDDGEVRGRGARDHVPRVLDVAGGVGDDELALRRREVAVGHIDGDALLALGAEAVGEEGEIDVFVAALLRGRLDGLHLVFEGVLGVVEEAPDEGRFAVVHAARRGEAEQVHVEVAFVDGNVGVHEKLGAGFLAVMSG